ncbi:anchored repeat-type ABC transporter permease subunit [Alloscardovia theropitheci]|uniref:Anchored repeat-type ABC transporter permease subunit n=1 Tax=Alloscardovia theropitheci TaxID=2496842 RepID=A0A4V2MTZ4_9BIFI|nr:anchored repeat-type ABC transporter permease subunit [Alloscardovia theropitheci]TCD54379.1 anchored repeat-type ABC transporter permease subunit [Alloscardovia theropitheci]
MLSIMDFINDLYNPILSFLPRALLVAAVSAVVCAIVGTHVVLRGMAFIGDAVAHAVFPGLAFSFITGGSLVLGGAVAGIATAILVALLSQNRRLKEDSVIGVLFVGAFALGIVIISRSAGYAGSLQDFLFGSLTGVSVDDIPLMLIGSLVVISILAFFNKELVAVSIDRETARALGIPVLFVDIVLYVSVALAVVISVQTIGNVLVLALLVAPAATARLVTNRMSSMMTVASILSLISSFVGIYLSWALDLPAGATIVCVLTVVFASVWLCAPHHGILAKYFSTWKMHKNLSD